MLEYFRSMRSLVQRISDLEHQNEVLMGANNVLQEQLSLAQNRADKYLEKLFSVVGVNKEEARNERPASFSPIQLAKRGRPWSEIREELESQAHNKALEDYWSRKQEIRK